MSTNNDTTYVSKPPKFEGKKGSAYVVWSIKFQSWAGVKGVRKMFKARGLVFVATQWV